VTAAAKCAVDVNFGNGPSGEGNILYKTHQIAQRIAEFWVCLGGEIEHPVDTNMVWLDLKKAGIEPAELRGIAKERWLRLTRGRIVVHYQITEEAVVRLEGLLTDIIKR
jgi:threonine aldolase